MSGMMLPGEWHSIKGGITPRVYLAGQALNGFVGIMSADNWAQASEEQIDTMLKLWAPASVQVADAVLAELDKEEGEHGQGE